MMLARWLALFFIICYQVSGGIAMIWGHFAASKPGKLSDRTDGTMNSTLHRKSWKRMLAISLCPEAKTHLGYATGP